jgi:hypothetical protein
VLKRALIFVHRWLGVLLCLLFLIWFPSGIGMMYWPYPSITPADRLARSPALDRSKIMVSPVDAYGALGLDEPPASVRLNSFDGRPVYRFRAGRFEHVVFADTAEELGEITMDTVNRIASAWTSQPASARVSMRSKKPTNGHCRRVSTTCGRCGKFSWPNGEQVYVSQATGNVVQYTNTASRLGAYAGPILHWLYFTPLRRDPALWSRLIIWSSGIGTGLAIVGIAIAIWMYSPRKRYRYDGSPTSIPYRGQKRWHMVFGLVFGVATVTWVFSGLLSMEPFDLRRDGAPVEPTSGVVRIPQAFGGRMQFGSFAGKGSAPGARAGSQPAGERTGVHVDRRRAGLSRDDQRRREPHHPRGRRPDRRARSSGDHRSGHACRGSRARRSARDQSVRRVLSRSTARAAAARDPRLASTTPT